MKKKLLAFSLMLLSAIMSLEAIDLKVDDYTNSDINFYPMFPVQNQAAFIKVRLHNPSEQAIDNIEIKVNDEQKNLIAEQKIASVPADTEIIVDIPFTPIKNGYQNITVTLSDNKDLKLQVTTKMTVISRPLFFPWFGGDKPGNEKLKYANVVLSFSANKSDYWRGRGAIVTAWKGVIMDMKTPEEYANYLKNDLERLKVDGIMIDEMGNYDEQAIVAMPQVKGLQKFNQENPEFFSMLWIAGSMRANYCNIAKNLYRKKGVDFILIECYANFILPEFSAINKYEYFDQRIDMARSQDVLNNALMTLGVSDNADKFNLTTYEIEDQVRYVKRKAPEMPGIGFFHANGKEQDMVFFSDDLCRKYYLEPVIQLYQYDLQYSPISPTADEEIEIFAHVYNIGGMDAQDVEVKLFSDERQILAKNLSIPAFDGKKLIRPTTISGKVKLAAGFHKLRAEVVLKDKVGTVLDSIAFRDIYVKDSSK